MSVYRTIGPLGSNVASSFSALFGFFGGAFMCGCFLLRVITGKSGSLRGVSFTDSLVVSCGPPLSSAKSRFGVSSCSLLSGTSDSESFARDWSVNNNNLNIVNRHNYIMVIHCSYQ